MWQTKCDTEREAAQMTQIRKRHRWHRYGVGCHLLDKSVWKISRNLSQLLLHKHLGIFGISKITLGSIIKVRQFWSDFDVFAHFGLRGTSWVHWYPPLHITFMYDNDQDFCVQSWYERRSYHTYNICWTEQKDFFQNERMKWTPRRSHFLRLTVTETGTTKIGEPLILWLQ